MKFGIAMFPTDYESGIWKRNSASTRPRIARTVTATPYA
jgi:hypothetical protein